MDSSAINCDGCDPFIDPCCSFASGEVRSHWGSSSKRSTWSLTPKVYLRVGRQMQLCAPTTTEGQTQLGVLLSLKWLPFETDAVGLVQVCNVLAQKMRFISLSSFCLWLSSNIISSFKTWPMFTKACCLLDLHDIVLTAEKPQLNFKP